MTDDNIITLYKAANAAEAQLLASALDADGIAATVDQTPSPFDGVDAIAGVDVFVREADASKAKAVLDGFLAEQGGGDD